jgi:cobalt-zinc-cadmium efflux system outer membrane protein
MVPSDLRAVGPARRVSAMTLRPLPVDRHGTHDALGGRMGSSSGSLVALHGCAAIAFATALLVAHGARAQHSTVAEPTDALPNPLRIEDVVRYARTHRAELLAARARARAAAERPAIVSALEDPMVSPSLDHLPFKLDGADVSLTVEQRFPLSGVLGHRERAAQADARREQSQLKRVGLDVELNAAEAYLMLRERRQMLRVLEEQRELAQQFVAAAHARYAAGAGAQADALRAEIEVARLAGAVRSTTAQIRANEIMLNASLGRSTQAAVPELDEAVADAQPLAAEAIRTAALARRPELSVGDAEISRAHAEVSAMQSMYSPMAMVRTGPAYTMMEGAGWMLMVGISVPLWRGKLRAGVNEAEAMLEMAQADRSAMRRMVEGEALSSREETIAARELYLALRDEIVPRALQAIEPALAAYASGQLPLVSVIEAAQALWSSQAELLSAQSELGLAWARLHRALGESGDAGARP